jgi:hypothetical protein
MPDGTNVRFDDNMSKEQIKNMIATKFPDFAANNTSQQTFTPSEETLKRVENENPYYLDTINNAIRKIGGAVEAWDQGKYFGFGKKFGGAANAILSYPIDRGIELATGKEMPTFGDRYNEIVQGAMDMNNEFAEEHPFVNFGTNIYGAVKGLPSKMTTKAIDAVGKLTQNSGKIARGVSKLGAYGSTGAASAVATGAGNSDDIVDYLGSKNLIDNAISGAEWSVAVPVGVYGIKKGAFGLGKIGQQVLGKTTGAGDKAVGDAFVAGKGGDKTFLENMRSNISPERISNKIENNFNKIKQARNMTYDNDISRLKLETVDKNLDIKPVLNDARAIIKEVEGETPYLVKGQLRQVIDEVKEMLGNFSKDGKNHNLSGFDSLKQGIQSLNTKEGTRAEMVQTRLANAVKNQILKQSPEYKAIQDNYAKDSEILNDLKSVFSLKRNANSETILRKIQSTARNNANTDWGYRAQLLKQLDPTGEISREISANALNPYTFRGQGIAGVAAGGAGGYIGGVPGVITAAAMTSPRLVGESAYKLGQIVNAIERLSNKINEPVNIGGITTKKEVK